MPHIWRFHVFRKSYLWIINSESSVLLLAQFSRTIKIKAIRIGIVKYVGTLKPIMPNYTSEWLRDPSPFKLGARIFPNYFTIDLASTLRLIRCFVTEIDPVVKPWESSPL